MVLEKPQPELGISLNDYVYMNSNMGHYIDLLEVHTFAIEKVFDETSEEKIKT